jgi:hypothetical protein
MKTKMTLLILSLCMLSCAQNDSDDRGDSKSGTSMMNIKPMVSRQVAHQPRINHTWQWAVMGLTMDELVSRFGAPQILNSGQYLFKKFDPEVHVNWHITVNMWQVVHQRQAIVNQVRFERQVKFSPYELRFLREINSKGLKWEAAGSGKGWSRFKTVVPNELGSQYDPVAQPELRAGVKHINALGESSEAVIYTLRFR